MMTTDSPGFTSAIRVAEPHPVGTPQPTRAATSNGMSLSIFTTDVSCTTMYGENVPRRHMGMTFSPRAWMRKVPSLIASPLRSPIPRSQRFWCPAEHAGQRPQAGTNDSTTWSPTSRSFTSGPSLVMTPEPSCPPITGKEAIGIEPVTMWWSEWHIPAASMRICTSPATGSPISISSTDHGSFRPHRIAPLVFM